MQAELGATASFFLLLLGFFSPSPFLNFPPFPAFASQDPATRAEERRAMPGHGAQPRPGGAVPAWWDPAGCRMSSS